MKHEIATQQINENGFKYKYSSSAAFISSHVTIKGY